MERMRQRQLADLDNPLKPVIGESRMRGVYGSITMKSGIMYKMDDYQLSPRDWYGERTLRFVESHSHKVRTVNYDDVQEITEDPKNVDGYEMTFEKLAAAAKAKGRRFDT